MDSQLKSIFFSSAKFKRQLLMPHHKVKTFQAFLKNTIHDEVVIVNTNLGIDIYYLSDSVCGNLIENAFFLLTSKEFQSKEQYRITMCNSTEEVRKFTKTSFLQLGNMPLIFNSYTKSMLYQFNHNFATNHTIIKELFVLWQSVLDELCLSEGHSLKISQFKVLLQEAYIDVSTNEVFRKLLKDSLDQLRCN